MVQKVWATLGSGLLLTCENVGYDTDQAIRVIAEAVKADEK